MGLDEISINPYV